MIYRQVSNQTDIPCKKNKKNDVIILAHFLSLHFVSFSFHIHFHFQYYFFLSIMHWVKRLSVGIGYFPIDMIPMCLQYSHFFTLCRHYGPFLRFFHPMRNNQRGINQAAKNSAFRISIYIYLYLGCNVWNQQGRVG